MPDTTTYGGDPIPTGPEGAWVPGSLMAYAESIDPKLVHAVANQAERDATFSTLPAGHIVVCAALKTVWLSLGLGTWHVAASDSGNVTAGFSYESGWTPITVRVRKRNGFTECFLYLTYSGFDIVSTGNGNIADTPIATIPAAYAPVGAAVFAMASWQGLYVFCSINLAGQVTVISGAPNATFTSGATFSFYATWIGA